MSHIWTSHVNSMNESCYTYEWVMSHIWMSHVTHMNELCHTYEWVMSHTWMSHLIHMNELSHVYVPYRQKGLLWSRSPSTALCISVMSRIGRRHVIHVNSSEWVMSHIWMSHVAHMNESYHMNESCRRNSAWSSQVYFKTAQLKLLYCRVLQCVAECCSVLQSVAVRCRVPQCVAECYSVLYSVPFQTAQLERKWTLTVQSSVSNSNNHVDSNFFVNGL